MRLFRIRRRQMDCPEVARLLQQYLDRELDDGVKARLLAQHLSRCVRCGLEAEAYRHIKASLSAVHRNDVEFANALERLRVFGERLAAAD